MTTATLSILDRLAASAAKRTAPPFPIKTRIYSRRKVNADKRRVDSVEARTRRMRARLVRPENAAIVAAEMPAPGDTMHAILAGDFVFCDLLPAVAALPGVGPLRRLDVATLSLSFGNIDTLAALVADGVPFDCVISHYFRGTNKPIFSRLADRLAKLPGSRLIVGRAHCKIVIMEFDAAVYCMESSANLRTSQNLEQLTVFNEPEIAEFHRAWIRELAEIPVAA